MTYLAFAASILLPLTIQVWNVRRDIGKKLKEDWEKQQQSLKEGIQREWQAQLDHIDTLWETKTEDLFATHRSLEERQREAEKAIAVMRSQIDVFWRGVGFNAAQILHSPHTPVLDALLDKYMAQRLTGAERDELRRLLREAVLHEEDRVKRASASDLLLILNSQESLDRALAAVHERFVRPGA